MEVFAEYTNQHKERCRIKFDIDPNMNATRNYSRPLWMDKHVGLKLKIYDSALHRINRKGTKTGITKHRMGSTVFIDTDITVAEISEAVKTYMREIYNAPEDSLVVSVSL